MKSEPSIRRNTKTYRIFGPTVYSWDGEWRDEMDVTSLRAPADGSTDCCLSI